MADDRIGLPVEALGTPCLLVDLDRMEANIQAMAAMANRLGVGLRPHVKTHKSPVIAKLQLAAGAVGITVAKVSEAEVMHAGGIHDIFIAYPIVTPEKARRAAALLQSGCRLIVGVESGFGAQVLSSAAVEAGVTMEVRIEVNTGLFRCGVLPEETLALATRVRSLPGLSLEGLFTFRSTQFPGSEGRTAQELGHEEGTLMAALANDLRSRGISIDSVSVGSTPTSRYAAVAGVTEVRPGTYVFNDHRQVYLGTASLEMVAVSVLATVVSRQGEDLATVDAGAKVFGGDVGPASVGGSGYGIGYFGDPLTVVKMSEEHGVVKLGPGLDPHIGTQVRLVPNHVCTSVNLSDELFGIRGGIVERIFPVAARGKRE